MVPLTVLLELQSARQSDQSVQGSGLPGIKGIVLFHFVVQNFPLLVKGTDSFRTLNFEDKKSIFDIQRHKPWGWVGVSTV